MENQTRFDLNAAIEDWRQELAAQPNLASDDRRELETHLRDAIAGFRQRGLSDEESFWLARRRTGQPQQLGEEFVKADPAKVWRERVFWMWLAVFLSCTLGSIASPVSLALMAINIQTDFLVTARLIMAITLTVLSILIPLVLVILLAKGTLVSRFSKLMSLVESRRRLSIGVLVCVALSSVIRFIAYASYYPSIKLHVPAFAWVSASMAPTLYALVAGLILVWLKPVHNQKISKRT